MTFRSFNHSPPVQALPDIAALPTQIPASINTTLKYDTMSHLEVDVPRNFPGDPEKPPEFVPENGLSYLWADQTAGMYLLEPSAKWPGCLYISSITQNISTKRPVGARWVETILEIYGLKEAASLRWRVEKCDGVYGAMESF